MLLLHTPQQTGCCTPKINIEQRQQKSVDIVYFLNPDPRVNSYKNQDVKWTRTELQKHGIYTKVGSSMRHKNPPPEGLHRLYENGTIKGKYHSEHQMKRI